MKSSFLLLITFNLSFVSCGQKNRNVVFFQGTKAYELAIAVEKHDVNEIERIIKEKPKLLDILNPTSGSNALALALTLEKFESFEKLLELGANPNFVNPYTKSSILIDATRFYYNPEEYTIDLRYISLLLQKGADPNYSIENDYENEKGHQIMVKSPLTEASKLNLDIVKTLIKAGANPYKKLGKNQESAFYSALTGFKDKFIIANYFIDSLKVDVFAPLFIRNKDSLFIQDIVVNKLTLAKLKNENVDIGVDNKERWQFIKKLERLGVDFKNYTYKE